MSTLTHEERGLVQRYAALCHGTKAARVSPAGRELQGLRRSLRESMGALKAAVLELYPWEQQERRSFAITLSPSEHLDVRIVQSQRAVTPPALASAAAEVDGDEVAAQMSRDENDVAERSEAEERLAAWWNCALNAAHAACVAWTPVIALRAAPPPAGARCGSEDIARAAVRVRQLEQQLADALGEQSAPSPAALQAELLAVLRRHDGVVPRVAIEDEHGTSRYRITTKHSVRRRTLTPAFLRQAPAIGGCAGDIEKLMHSAPAERVANATALLDKIRDASAQSREQVAMVGDDN